MKNNHDNGVLGVVLDMNARFMCEILFLNLIFVFP
jgi:hypothetical protein